jgi:hypothetical protein
VNPPPKRFPHSLYWESRPVVVNALVRGVDGTSDNLHFVHQCTEVVHSYAAERRDRVYGQRLVGYFGLKRRDVLPQATLDNVASRVARWRVPPNRQRAQEKWRKVVTAACTPEGVGSILVPSGGLPSLAQSLEVPDVSLGRNLETWEKNGLVRRHFGKRVRARPPLVEVELPYVAELLEWLAALRVAHLTEQHGAPSIKATYALLYTLIDRRYPPPTIATADDVRRVLNELKSQPPDKAPT